MHWGRMSGKRRQYFVLIMKDFYFFIFPGCLNHVKLIRFGWFPVKFFPLFFYIVNSTVSIDSTIFFIDPVMNWKFCPYFFQQFQIDCTGFTLLWRMIANQLQNHFDNQSHLAYSRFLAFSSVFMPLLLVFQTTIFVFFIGRCGFFGFGFVILYCKVFC